MRARTASGLALDVEPGHPHRACGGRQEARDHPHGRRLAGAVGPQEAQHLALRHEERDIRHHVLVDKAFRQSFHLDHISPPLVRIRIGRRSAASCRREPAHISLTTSNRPANLHHPLTGLRRPPCHPGAPEWRRQALLEPTGRPRRTPRQRRSSRAPATGLRSSRHPGCRLSGFGSLTEAGAAFSRSPPGKCSSSTGEKA